MLSCASCDLAGQIALHEPEQGCSPDGVLQGHRAAAQDLAKRVDMAVSLGPDQLTRTGLGPWPLPEEVNEAKSDCTAFSR